MVVAIVIDVFEIKNQPVCPSSMKTHTNTLLTEA